MASPEEIVERFERQLQEDYRTVLGSSAGRNVLWDVLQKGGIYQTTFSGESPLTSAFKEGRRDFALGLLNTILTIEEGAYRIMQAEAKRREDERVSAITKAVKEQGEHDG